MVSVRAVKRSKRPRYLKSRILGRPTPESQQLVAELKPLETWRVLLKAECWNGVLIHRYSVVGRGESLSSAITDWHYWVAKATVSDPASASNPE